MMKSKHFDKLPLMHYIFSLLSCTNSSHSGHFKENLISLLFEFLFNW